MAGAGLAGLAAAARLAKLGHSVTVCEAGAAVGGACHAVEHDGFSWDAGPASFTLPAVLRDLFRKSGRPLERYLAVQLLTPARRHVFDDGTVVDLPTGSRGAQSAAVEAARGAASAAAWTRFCDGQAAVWQRLRADVLDPADGGAALADRRVEKSLGGRMSLARRLRKDLPDPVLRQVAALPFAGARLRDVPAYGAVQMYVERTFGVWRVAGARLGRALPETLSTRLAERGVEVRLGQPVAAILTDRGRVTGIGTSDGADLPADHVVTDLDARRVLGALVDDPAVSAARDAFGAAAAAPVPHVTHLGLVGEVPRLPAEVVLHGDPLLVLRTGAATAGREGSDQAEPDQGGSDRTGSDGAVSDQAVSGRHAWTLLRWGQAADHEELDPVTRLRERGIDVNARVVARVDRSPDEIADEAGGAPYGLAWSGGADYARRARHTHPMPGLHLLGASVHPGPGLPYVMWGAAHVATRIGKA